MILGKFKIEIVSLPMCEDLVSEIFYEGFQWVQIYRKNNELLIQFYPHPQSEFWEFPVDLAIQALEKARSRLIEVG